MYFHTIGITITFLLFILWKLLVVTKCCNRLVSNTLINIINSLFFNIYIYIILKTFSLKKEIDVGIV